MISLFVLMLIVYSIYRLVKWILAFLKGGSALTKDDFDFYEGDD